MKIAAGLVLLCGASAANASLIWAFKLPSTATDAQTPPYPIVANLTLTQVGSDVQFELDPNQASPGVIGLPRSSTVKAIDIVYDKSKGGVGNLTGNFLSYVDGAAISSYKYDTKKYMGSSYKADAQHVVIKFDDFDFTETSTWKILGTTLDNFADTEATSGSHPTPIHGVIKVEHYDLNIQPDSSRWVAARADDGALPSQVPVPGSLFLFGSAMAGLITLNRRRRA